MKSHRINVAFAAVLAIFGSLSTADAQTGRPPARQPVDPDPTIARLIEQLGSDDFAVRQQAQAQLSRMGLEAFDALVAAQYPPASMEVQLRAKYLVRGMNVRWYDESDPPEVARLLKSFGEQSDDERRSRMDRLGSMTDVASITALCRLARYEVNPILSKHAAILILHRDEPKPGDPESAELREKIIAAITQGLGTSRRQAADWLRLYCRTLAEPGQTVDDWRAAIAQEQETLALQPAMTNRQVVRDLFRYQIKLLQQLKRDDEVIALMRQSIELLDGEPEQVKEIVDWLVHRQAYQVVLEVGDRFPHIVGDDGLLMYLRAHAYRMLKQPEPAKELAAAALKLRPNNLEEHLLVAAKLAETWGLFDYAEQEYREIMKTAPPGSVADFRARFLLSEQLHDQGQELPAAECLKPAVDLMFPEGADEAKGEMARDTAFRAGRDPDGVRSRMNYFFACHYNEQKEFDKAKKALNAAVESDPTDADVLIALFRLPNLTAEERAEVNDKITSAADEFYDMVKDLRLNLQNANDEADRASISYRLSSACNQYAWLVSNTQGDFDEALKCSRQSVELRPEEGGFWDTLGRCYYAKGDYENAVKEQLHAVKLMPHSGQIRRQLELFQKALADHKAGAKK
jgi:tetratricopeptide (TPR) repeat protein